MPSKFSKSARQISKYKGGRKQPPATNRASQEPASYRVKPKYNVKQIRKYILSEGEQLPLTSGSQRLSEKVNWKETLVIFPVCAKLMNNGMMVI